MTLPRQLSPNLILRSIYEQAANAGDQPVILDIATQKQIELVCRCEKNRAGVRLLMACLLAKLVLPEIDPRKPYTEIGSQDCFSGRFYDEKYLAPFIQEHQLPVNSTTAFLTPALRNHNQPLFRDRNLNGKPPELYASVLNLLHVVAEGGLCATHVFVETVRNTASNSSRECRTTYVAAEFHTP